MPNSMPPSASATFRDQDIGVVSWNQWNCCSSSSLLFRVVPCQSSSSMGRTTKWNDEFHPTLPLDHGIMSFDPTADGMIRRHCVRIHSPPEKATEEVLLQFLLLFLLLLLLLWATMMEVAVVKISLIEMQILACCPRWQGQWWLGLVGGAKKYHLTLLFRRARSQSSHHPFAFYQPQICPFS